MEHAESRAQSVTGYLLLYLPFVVALGMQDLPELSYWAAWLGSWWILFLSLTGKVRPLPQGLSALDQVLRPIVLTQVIFAGYTCLTSIFYYLDVHGYYYLQRATLETVNVEEMARVATAQRYYVLAHAAMVTGILLAMDYRTSGRWKVRISVSLPAFLLVVGVGATVAAVAFGVLPGLGQVAERMQEIALVASVLALAQTLARRRTDLLAPALLLYGWNMVQALFSGWKEEVIAIFVLLCAFSFPYYRRTVMVGAPIGMLLLFAVLPTYNQGFRQANWYGEMSAAEAAQLAIEEVELEDESTFETNWRFLTGRATEVGMFTIYLTYTPGVNPFYGTRLVEQAAASLVPRLLLPGKPNTEYLVMARVYENYVTSPSSPVSAKPQYVVDGYLSAGAAGVFLACLLFGLLASWASRLAERWFGGYLVGSGLIYTALFTILWRGNSFEFFANTVFWCFVLLFALHKVGRWAGLILPNTVDRPSVAG